MTEHVDHLNFTAHFIYVANTKRLIIFKVKLKPHCEINLLDLYLLYTNTICL